MRGKRLNNCIIAGILILMMVFAFGCGKTGDSQAKGTSDGTNKEMTSIKISAINTVSWAPVFIAQTEGMFEKQGLKVEFTTPGGPKGFQAMQAGDCEFCMLSQEPLLIAQEKGMKSKILATMLTGRIYGIISKTNITDISQLKGATIYGSDAGSAPYTFVCNVLQMANLDPVKDVNFVQAADQNAGMQALVKGEVDAAFVNMSNLPIMGDFKYNVLVDCTQPDQCQKYLGSSDFPGEMLCTTTDYATSHQKECQKVVNAVIDAEKWIGSHTDAEVAASLSSVFGNVKKDVIAQEIKLIRSNFSTDCKVSTAGQKAVVDMCIKAGLIKKDIPYDDVVDMEFVNNYSK